MSDSPAAVADKDPKKITASQDLLAHLIVSGEPMLIDVHVFWGFRPNKYGIQKLTVFTDEEAEKMMEDETTKDQVVKFNTKWKLPDWEEQNQIVAESQDMDQMTGQPIPNWSKYRELRIQRLLKEWDLKIDNKPVPISEEYIRRVPDVIMLALFDRFERAGAISPDEQGK